METTPDREEKMPAAAPEQAEVYRIEEDGDDLVIRIPRSVASRERVERLLGTLEFEQVDEAGAHGEIEGAVWELLGRGSDAGTAVNTGETAAVGLPDEPAEHLYFMSKVERGLRQIEAGQFVSHEEAKRRFGR